ncbi:hypothetical protein HND97_18910 [Vibrio cholerae]|nr:hypothetical protein HND97_18910 [Vibrio cholerae]
MDKLYKIESYSDEAVNTIAEFIRSKGGRCCFAGYAVITNHPFRESEAWRFLPLVGKVTDSLSDWDITQFEELVSEVTH